MRMSRKSRIGHMMSKVFGRTVRGWMDLVNLTDPRGSMYDISRIARKRSVIIY